MTAHEVFVCRAALRELLYGFSFPDFKARMGCTREEAAAVLHSLRWTPVFGRLDKVELRGWEAPYQEQDDGREATSIWSGIQGEGGFGGRQG